MKGCKKKVAAKKSSPKKAATKSGGAASNAVDEQLERYRSMRDFDVTAEPSGESSAKSKAKVELDCRSAFRSMRLRICTMTSGLGGTVF